MSLRTLKAMIAGLVITVSSMANAGVMYTVDSGWADFSWSGGVETTTDQGGFTFDLLTDGVLTVTDAYAFGDEFEIWINSAFNSNTSDVLAYDSLHVGGDADLAIASGFSHGSVFLSAGSYDVDFTLFQDGVDQFDNPYLGGGAFFKVETATIPEPSTLAIFALAIMGLASRKFKK